MSGSHDMTKADYVRVNMQLMLENQRLRNEAALLRRRVDLLEGSVRTPGRARRRRMVEVGRNVGTDALLLVT